MTQHEEAARKLWRVVDGDEFVDHLASDKEKQSLSLVAQFLAARDAEKDRVIAELREKSSNKESDRQYHMDAINRLAVGVNVLGTTSVNVVSEALAKINGYLNQIIKLDAAYCGNRQRAEAAESKVAELRKEMDELHRAISEIHGVDPETWPSHGNRTLAIAALLQLRVNDWRSTLRRAEKAEASLALKTAAYEKQESCYLSVMRAKDSSLAAMTDRRDDLQRGCNGLNGKYEHARLKCEELKIELAALRQPVGSEEERGALALADSIPDEEFLHWEHDYKVLARALRQRTAALKEAEEKIAELHKLRSASFVISPDHGEKKS